MRQIMHYDAEFRREEGDLRSRLSREALTASGLPNLTPRVNAGQAGRSFGAQKIVPSVTGFRFLKALRIS